MCQPPSRWPSPQQCPRLTYAWATLDVFKSVFYCVFSWSPRGLTWLLWLTTFFIYFYTVYMYRVQGLVNPYHDRVCMILCTVSIISMYTARLMRRGSSSTFIYCALMRMNSAKVSPLLWIWIAGKAKLAMDFCMISSPLTPRRAVNSRARQNWCL